MKRSEVFVTVFYVVVLFIVVSVVVVVYGLTFHYVETVNVLQTIVSYGILVALAVVAYVVYHVHANLKHKRLMKQQDYIRSKTETQKVAAQIYLTNQQAQAIMIKSMMELEKTRIEASIALQQSQVITVSVSESLYVRQGNDFTQIAQGQMPVRAGQKAVQAIHEQQQFIPSAPGFRDMHHLITDENTIVVGYSANRPLFGTVEKHMLSKIIIGMPGQGKSTALLYDLGVLIKANTFPFVFDPQGSLSELDGILPYVSSMKNIYSYINLIYDELNERDELWRNGKQTKSPFLFLVDELPLIAAYEQRHKVDKGVLDVVQSIVLECRKYKCYCIVAGQSMPATVIPTMTRDNMSSRLIFNTSDRQALTVGLDEVSRKVLLPFLDMAGIGVGILDMSIEKQPKAVAIPYTDIDDITTLVNGDDRYEEWLDKFTIDALPQKARSIQESDIPELRENGNLVTTQEGIQLQGDLLLAFNAYKSLAQPTTLNVAKAMGCSNGKAGNNLKRLRDMGFIH